MTVGPVSRSSGAAPAACGPSGVIGEVGRQRQLLQADDHGPLGGGHPDPVGQRLLMLVGIGVPALLHQPDPQRRALGRPRARGRGRRRVGGQQHAAAQAIAHRHLLGDAVRAAAAVGQHQAGHRHDLAAGVGGGDDLERRLVGVGAGDGHDHAHDCRCRSSGSSPRPSRRPPRRRAAAAARVTSIPAAASRARFSSQSLEVGVVLGDGLQQDPARGDERGDQVDVAVGVAVLDQPLPSHTIRSDPEARRSSSASICSRDSEGLRLGLQQALLGRQQRALAVGQDRAALQHQRRLAHLVAQPLGDQPADRGVPVPGRELLAPGVEAEVDGDRARRRRRRSRSGRSRAARSRPAAARRSPPRPAGRPRRRGVAPGLAIIVTGSNAATALATAA